MPKRKATFEDCIEQIDLEKARYLCSLPKIIGQHPENGKDITINSGRFGPYLKCENKSARLENDEDLFSIGINRAITLIEESKPISKNKRWVVKNLVKKSEKI